MVGDHPIYIAFGKQFGKFGGTELLQRHHPAELADGFIVQGIKEDLSDFFHQQLLRDVGENRDILLGILYMDRDLSGVFLVVRRSCFQNRIENRLLAGEVVIQRGSLDADRFCNFTHADRIVSFGRKQFQRFFQNALLGIFHFSLPFAN